MLWNEVEFTCTSHGLSTIGDRKFGEDIADMALDSVDRDHQLIGDSLVGGARGNQAQDFEFSFAKRIKQGLRGCRRQGMMSSGRCTSVLIFSRETGNK